MTALPTPLARLRPIGLEEINATARLLNRVDRKYFVPRAVLTRLLSEHVEDMRVLEIDAQRSFLYRTVYYDTEDFLFFRQHRQGRRHRFKVRTREYVDTGGAFLEVKSKGYRGMTVKQRREHDPADLLRLDPESGEFAETITGTPWRALHPVAETLYRRTTLAGPGLRITMDSDLRFSDDFAAFAGPEDVIVETKSSGSRGALDRALAAAGVRPHKVSKYCLAVSLLHPELAHNPWIPTLRRYFPPGSQMQAFGELVPDLAASRGL